MSDNETILVVDDENELRELLANFFEPLGKRVIFADNGLAALETIKSEPISAICCDLKMPEMGGLEFVERIRQMGFFTPVLILTGFGTDEYIDAAKRLGAMAFVSKPAGSNVLKDLMLRALEVNSKLEELDAALRKELQNADLDPDELARIYSTGRAEHLAIVEGILLGKSTAKDSE